CFFFFQAEDGIRDFHVTGVQTCALPILPTDEVLNKSAYQYWVDGTWAPAAENSATPLIPGIAGELSVRFDDSSGQWQMVYLDPRSEERRVGKECRPRKAARQCTKECEDM